MQDAQACHIIFAQQSPAPPLSVELSESDVRVPHSRFKFSILLGNFVGPIVVPGSWNLVVIKLWSVGPYGNHVARVPTRGTDAHPFRLPGCESLANQSGISPMLRSIMHDLR